jgi:uncharacterized membrane protein
MKKIAIVFLILVIGALVFLLNRKNVPNQENKRGDQATPVISNDGFLGEKGKTVQAEGDKILIDENEVNDENLHAFNYYSTKAGKNLYFFIIKASDGTYRAAANACEVCFGAKKGFTQVGDLIKCENCGTTYAKDQIAVIKGGCNPRPISRNVPVANSRLAIDLTDIESIAGLF